MIFFVIGSIYQHIPRCLVSCLVYLLEKKNSSASFLYEKMWVCCEGGTVLQLWGTLFGLPTTEPIISPASLSDATSKSRHFKVTLQWMGLQGAGMLHPAILLKMFFFFNHISLHAEKQGRNEERKNLKAVCGFVWKVPLVALCRLIKAEMVFTLIYTTECKPHINEV